VLTTDSVLPQRIAERLGALRARPIDATEKGFAFQGGRTAASLAEAHPPLHQAGLNYPLLSLRESALRANARAMAGFCTRHGVDLAPHGKTHMSPELAALQTAHGSWAITVASIGQARVYRGFGFHRLLLANELTDRAGIAWLASEMAAHPDFEPYIYVDNMKTTELLARTYGGSAPGHELPVRALPVLVEIGHADGRTGCRTDEEAIAVAKAVSATAGLRLAGVSGYEGTIRHDGTPETLAQVTGFCRRLRRLAGTVRPGDAEDFVVSAGGSTSFDVVTEELTRGGTDGLRVVLRSGAYLPYDHGIYARFSPGARGVPGAPRFQPAIELWAQVLSRPEPGLAVLGLGRRDAGFGSDLPVPLRTGDGDAAGRDWTVVKLMDQHAYLSVPDQAPLAPGDLVCFGISHPCTTLDKWRVMPVVDDDGLIRDVVHAFF
jgi:D-serine deaminase-like pyridoxal phosphate-dependent protein